jgi:hypothetical protein
LCDHDAPGANERQVAEATRQILTDHQQLRRVCNDSRLQTESCKLITVELGVFQHAVEGEMLCESKNVKIPYFNAPIYLENKALIPLEISRKPELTFADTNRQS